MYSEVQYGEPFKAEGPLATTFESGTHFLDSGTTKKVMEGLISEISKADSDRLNAMLGGPTKEIRASKINRITEPYFAELGVLSEREHAIAYYTKLLKVVTGDKKLTDYFENQGISHGFDVSKSQEALREALLAVSDDKIAETVQGFYSTKQFQDLYRLVIKSGTPCISYMTEVKAIKIEDLVLESPLDLGEMGELSNGLEQICDSPQPQVSPSTVATRTKRTGQMTMC